MTAGRQVLLTGGSGFVGAHTVARLLGAGYRVRATVRTEAREPQVRAMVAAAGADPGGALTVVAADLTADAGWAQAAAGCDLVLHVASPFPATAPRTEDELIVPARDGTLRVLRAARDAGARRVVLTSSFAAVGYGHPPTGRAFTEADWTDPQAPVSAYVRSKTLAERAAWDFVTGDGGDMQLVTINPVGVFGPVLGPDYASSIRIVRGLLDGRPARLPNLAFGVVDVRDLADLQLRAMVDPAAAGQRFLATSGEVLTMRQVAALLRERLGAAGSRVPTRGMPDWAVRAAAPFSAQARQVAADLGVVRRASNARARQVLGWVPRPAADTMVDTAQSLLHLPAAA